MENFRDEQAAQDAMQQILLLEQAYKAVRNEIYPLAVELINRGSFVVTDSTIEDAFYCKDRLEQGIVSCQKFVYAYNGGKFTPEMKAFAATSERRRFEYGQMWNAFDSALDIVKDGILHYKLWKSDRDVLMKILKQGSDIDTLKKLYADTVDFETMLNNCAYVLDAAWDLDFDLSKDKVLDNYVKQLKKILYDIRGKNKVEALLNAPYREDVRAAFSALYDERDPRKAMHLYEQAAKAGSGEAMFELGQLYRHFWRPCISADIIGGAETHPVARDLSKAMDWYRKAAEVDYAPAMDALGGCYESPDYGIKDINAAIHWYKRAALLGCSRSARTLARIYQEGKSVPKDTTEARRWREMFNFDNYREGIKKLKAEFNPNAPVKPAETPATATWMNSDKTSTSTTPASTHEKKTSSTKSTSEEPPADNTTKEMSKEDYPGAAFWLCLIGLYCFTSVDLMTSGIVALIVAGVVHILCS